MEAPAAGACQHRALRHLVSIRTPAPCPAATRHRPRRRPPSLRAARAAAVSADSPTVTQLYSQLAGVLAPGGAVVAAPTPLGRGLVATAPIAPGDTLLSVDWCNLLCVTDQPARGDAFGRRVLQDWQLLHGRLPPLLVRYLLGDEGDWFVRLAAWLLWLRNHAAGPWRLYIDLLPAEAEMTALMNFRPHELDELQSPRLASRAALERSQISGLHDRLFSAESGELRALALAASLDDTVWACGMVNSRCFSETVGGETVSLVVPCADMANHALAPAAAYRYDTAADAFQLTATRPLPAGAEACISYGCAHKDSEALMRDYGFVLPGNVNDRVPFSAGDDVASQLAARAAGGAADGPPSLSAPRLLAALGLGGAAQGAFDLSAAAERAMGDSEADAATRRTLATLLSLQPFLRDIPQSGSGPGGAPPPLGEAQRQREARSAAALAAQCAAALRALPTSADGDAVLLAAGADGGEPLAPRRRAAVAARLEHKRLLQAAEAVLLRYAASLQ